MEVMPYRMSHKGVEVGGRRYTTLFPAQAHADSDGVAGGCVYGKTYRPHFGVVVACEGGETIASERRAPRKAGLATALYGLNLLLPFLPLSPSLSLCQPSP